MADKHPFFSVIGLAGAFAGAVYIALQYVQVLPLEREISELRVKLNQIESDVTQTRQYKDLATNCTMIQAKHQLMEKNTEKLSECRNNYSMCKANQESTKKAYESYKEAYERQAERFKDLQRKASLINQLEKLKEQEQKIDHRLDIEINRFQKDERDIARMREQLTRIQEQINAVLKGLECEA